jgi:hypothetical protein
MVFFIDPDTGEVEAAPGGFLPHYFDDPYGLCLWSHDGGVDVFLHRRRHRPLQSAASGL